jgi:hypothetical protein
MIGITDRDNVCYMIGITDKDNVVIW